MYDRGLGVAPDIGKAVHWYRLAAEQGNAGAQTNLCACYGNGNGVELDLEKAFHWCRLAAHQGYDGAQCNLGAAYYDGKGVGQDYVQAYSWFALAQKSARHPDLKALAAQALEIVAQKLGPEQKSEAERLVSEWKPAE
jgi:TPR repeat protein